jgi:hypothetical protein
MIRKRVPKLLTILATAACIFGFVLVAPTASENLPSVSPLPIAGAEVLPNGYDVNCTKVNDLQVVCTVGGCPRVNVEDDLAGDELHVHINGDAANGKEVPKGCGDVYSETINIDAYKPFTYHVQGVRHHDVGSEHHSGGVQRERRNHQQFCSGRGVRLQRNEDQRIGWAANCEQEHQRWTQRHREHHGYDVPATVGHLQRDSEVHGRFRR